MKEFVEGKVYTQMRGGADGGISGSEEEEVARASRYLSVCMEYSVFLSGE